MKEVLIMIENYVKECLGVYGNGENYFNMLDDKIKNDVKVFEKLYRLAEDYYKTEQDFVIIVSGEFGLNFLNWFPYSQEVILVEGGLRKGNEITHVFQKNYNNYAFIDDSYYLGRTAQKIVKKIEESTDFFDFNVFVAYDGGRDGVKSLFSYWEWLEKEYWNKENLGFSNTEEFQYLDRIDNVFLTIKHLVRLFEFFQRGEERKITEEKEKKKKDLTRIETMISLLKEEILNL